jgi:hypothetical protein
MVSEWVTAEERKISGKGVLRVPPGNEDKQIRAYILFASVVRPPRNKYANYNWNPPRSRYANMSFFRNSYLMHTLAMEYEYQAWDGINDISGQTLIAVKCMYDGVLQTFVNLANAMSATPGGVGLFVTQVENTIKEYKNLRLAWDEIRVQCYADTAINLRLDVLPYDVCDANYMQDEPPPPSPIPPPPVPPGTPILDISEPYEPSEQPETGDDGDTAPFPGDSPILPPEYPPPGRTVRLTILWSQSGQPPTESSMYVTTPYFVWHNDAIIEGFYTLNPNNPYGYPFNVISGQGGLNPPTAGFISATDDSGYDVDVRIKP